MIERLPVRLLAKIMVLENGCWLWTGTKDGSGYGRCYFQGRTQAAHRITYALLVKAIPIGKQLDHLCRVHNCVNPKHLEAVTCRENLLRGIGLTAQNVAKTHCPNGHPYAGTNLRASVVGDRRCRQCNRDYNHQRQQNPVYRMERIMYNRAYRRRTTALSEETKG